MVASVEPPSPDGGSPARDPRVDDRVLTLLSESPGTIAFNGLRRALGVHPESLTRALRRLQREGSVVRAEGGYALRDPLPGGREAPPPARTVASLALPAGISRDAVMGLLAGRWFASLRWVGVYEHPGDPWLVWAGPDGRGHVFVSVRRHTLRIMTETPEVRTPSRALDAAAEELLVRAVTLLRGISETAGPGALALRRSDPEGPPQDN